MTPSTKHPSRVHGYDIRKASVRHNLAPRREPYWSSNLGTGRSLGFRRSETGLGSWIARWTEPTKEVDSLRPKYRYGALGAVPDTSYEAALEEANRFFTSCERNYRNRNRDVSLEDIATIEDGVRRYFEHLRKKKGDDAAEANESKLAGTIYGTSFGRQELDDLQTIHVEQWVNGLVTPTRNKVTANRIFRQFKAAMNYLRRLERLESDNPWRNVSEFPVKSGRRNAKVRSDQYQEMLNACNRRKDERELRQNKELRQCTPALGKLMRGGMITGARPKELMTARCSAYEVSSGTLQLVSNKNRHGVAKVREFYIIGKEDQAFFAELVKDRLPDDYLFLRDDGTPWVYTEGKLAGKIRSREQCEGVRAAVADANTRLPKERRIAIPDDQKGRTTFYTLRHTSITDLLNSGAEISAVGDAVGNSPQMIKEYYDQDRKARIRNELAKRHPSAAAG